MKLKTVLLLFAALAVARFVQATPITITNEDAAALFGSLSQIQSGLSPVNVGKGAENIWLLKAVSEAFSSQQLKASRDSAKNTPPANTVPTPEQLKESEKIQNDWDKFRMATMTLDLQPMVITEDEIKEAKITPAVYAPIRHYLSPAPETKK